MRKKVVVKSKKIRSKKISPEEVCRILRDKYHVRQADIDFLDEEYRLELRIDMQNTPMLNDDN